MNIFHSRKIGLRRSVQVLSVLCISLGVLVLLVCTYTAATAADQTASKVTEINAQFPPWVEQSASTAGSAPSRPLSALAELPPPQQDPCQHCHIAGENKGLVTPLFRWTLFGAAGLIFGIGLYRTTAVWRTRKPWRSFSTRAADWVDERYRIKKPLESVLSKPVPRFALRWWYCLGGITAFLFVLQAVTGIMLAFYYKPTPEQAYASIQYIETQVLFGASIRAIHHWAANGMIVMCLAHMLRVFIMGVYKPPRELNWVNGVLLLVFTLAFGFTGYLLPWDQRAFWATTVGTEIGGAIPVVGELVLVFLRVGWVVNDLTLSRFYALHVIMLPILTIVMMGLHFLMIRRQGIARPL